MRFICLLAGLILRLIIIMLKNLINWSIHNRFLVLIATGLLATHLAATFCHFDARRNLLTF
ncbi:membrane protein [Candidatus Thiomargarita nelsonii]|uniref:Membrane protein n=1 Tax=Candidatus Thiomargarita nelsonii TaxID=1003181 RepID=A0A176S1K3_9GAMM|nr:membrane protein [Candidatus Thiomargarita nelsonii]